MAAGGGEGEINLVPYMDIVITLILAMVVMTSTVTELDRLRSAPVEAPPIGPGVGAAPAPLSVAIEGGGFDVSQGGTTVHLARDAGVWPFVELTETLRALRDAGDATATLQVRAAPTVPVSVLVATMDAARSDAGGMLYPSVALGVAAR